MDPVSSRMLGDLLATRSVAALGTLRDGAPYVSMVLVAPDPAARTLLIHVSRLSPHTQDLLKDPRLSLMIVGAEAEGEDPQTLPRVTVRGEAAAVPAGSEDDAAARAVYLARFPEAEPLLELPDFSFFRIKPAAVRFVAGFARAFNLTPDALWEALASR